MKIRNDVNLTALLLFVCCFPRLMFNPNRSFIYLGQLCHLANYPIVGMIIKTQNGANREEIRNFSIKTNYTNEETRLREVSQSLVSWTHTILPT